MLKWSVAVRISYRLMGLPVRRCARHATLGAYSAGKCRCEHRRGAYARCRAQRGMRMHPGCLPGGADLEVVKERLGHSSIVTTQKYVGTFGCSR